MKKTLHQKHRDQKLRREITRMFNTYEKPTIFSFSTTKKSLDDIENNLESNSDNIIYDKIYTEREVA